MDEIFEKRLQNMAGGYAELVILHEIGEHKEGTPEWKEILANSGDRKNEHYLRALKDLIADTSAAGPLKKIIETKDHAALALTVALMEGFHRLLFPEIRTAYNDFTRKGDWDAIEQARMQGYLRFTAARERILQIYRETRGQENFSSRLREVIE
jgi:hypothetical protein